MDIFDVNQIHHAIEQVPFFRSDNMEYYAIFFSEHPTLTPERVVLYVNIGLHYDFYERIFYIDNSYPYNVLVNKFYRNRADFSPVDLVEVAPGHQLRATAAAAFLEMQAVMEELGLPIVARSAYRSYQTQRELYDRNVANMGQEWADMWNARPGHSEHQLGLAIDVLQSGQSGVSLGAAGFEQTPQYAWLLENAHGFGFILSYPEAYTHVTGYAFEPWHWRYVGLETADYMFTHGVPTLDHYWATRVHEIPVSLHPNDYIASLDAIQTGLADSDYYQLLNVPQPSVLVESPMSTLNPVLFEVGQAQVTVAHLVTPVLAVLIGLIVFARVVGMRRRRRRRLARQYDFASRRPRNPQQQRRSQQRRVK